MAGLMETGTGRSWTALEWCTVGGDLLITVTGGESPHIGAAALAVWENGAPVVRFLQVPGHREKELACLCAEAACRAAERTVLVTCGIHIDGASREEIRRLCANVERLVHSLTERLRDGGS